MTQACSGQAWRLDCPDGRKIEPHCRPALESFPQHAEKMGFWTELSSEREAFRK